MYYTKYDTYLLIYNRYNLNIKIAYNLNDFIMHVNIFARQMVCKKLMIK